ASAGRSDRGAASRSLLRDVGLGVAADHGDPAGTGEFENAVWAHQFDERLDFPLGAADLDHDVLVLDVDDAAAEALGKLEDLGPLGWRAGDLNEHEIALDEVLGTDVVHADNGDDLVELFADLVKDIVIT